MASSLLDELPCLLDEADELMARLAFYIKLLSKPSGSRHAAPEPPADAARDDDQPSIPAIHECLSANETESALKFCARQFLTSQPVPVEKMLALLQIQREDAAAVPKRSPLQFVAKQVFHLMKRIHHWQRAAWGIVTQFFAEAAYLTFGKHRLLTALLLNTLAKYVKVHLLWTSCPTIPSLLAIHTFSQFRSASAVSAKPKPERSSAGLAVDQSASMYSPLDHADHHLREYVLCFGSNPLFKIQQDFQQHPDGGEIARNLAALALSCFESFLGCHDLEQLRNQGHFDIETFFLGDYAASEVYEDLLYSHEQEQWVLCVALCLPQHLRSSTSATRSGGNGSSVQLWDFVHVIAQDRLVLPVFRDMAVNLHTLLYQQIASTLSSGGATGSLATPATGSSSSSQTPLKKLMSALSKQALRTCGEQHAQRAQFAAWLLQRCINLLTQCGELAAPLFPVLLGACRVARDEIEWRLCHEDQSQQLLLPAHVKAKHLQRVQHSAFSGNAVICGDLLALVHRLRALVEQNVHCAKGYYEEFLACGDADAISYEIQELLDRGADEPESSHRPPLDPRVQQILRSFAVNERYQPVMTADIASSAGGTGKASPPWRREWRQLSIVLLSSSPSCDLPSSLLQLMERACNHAKYVESARSLLLDHHAQISKWWWHAALFEKLYQKLLASGASQALAMLDIVGATIAGSYALDEIVDETEAHEQVLRIQELCERMHTALGKQLERAIDAAVAAEAALHNARQRSDYSRAAKRSSHRSESRVAAASSSSLLSSAKASESRFPSAIASMRSSSGKSKSRTARSASNSGGSLGSLVKADEALCKLTSALVTQMTNDSSQVLSQLVERHVRICLVRFLRSLVELSDVSSTSSNAVAISCGLRCSLQRASAELQWYVTCIQRLFRDAPFVDLTRVVMDTLASESRAPRDKDVESCTAQQARPLLSEARQWNLIQRVTSFYLLMLQSSKCAPLATTAGSSPLPALLIASRRKQRFACDPASQSEDAKLSPEQFLTPEALGSLLEIVGSAGILTLGAALIRCVRSQAQKLELLLQQDEIALIRFGKCLDAPYSELAMAVRQMAGLEQIASQLAQIGLLLFVAERLEKVESAFTIQHDLQWRRMLELSGGGGGGSWRLLPVAFAASFHSDLWRRSKYIAVLEATDTNAHLSCTAVLHLLQLVRCSRTSEPVLETESDASSPAEPPPSKEDDLYQQKALRRRVVELSSQSVLGMRAAAKELPSPAMLAAVCMFAELAASTAGGGGGQAARLELGVLDECLPDIVFQSSFARIG